MWKNDSTQVSCSSFLRNNPLRESKTSLDWHSSIRFKKCSNERFKHERFILNKSPLSEVALHNFKTEAETGISQIQDPLWRRVCSDVLRTLGPVAFKNLWKTNLVSVSPRERRACITCPSQDIAEAVENYHFVIMGALKKFYPFLFSIETKIGENERLDRNMPKVSVNPYRHLA